MNNTSTLYFARNDNTLGMTIPAPHFDLLVCLVVDDDDIVVVGTILLLLLLLLSFFLF